jgi:peptide/nickel transport system substrate-binding protein
MNFVLRTASRPLRLAALLCAAALALTACGDDAPDKPTGAGAGTPKPGGTLTFQLAGDAGQLTPFGGSGLAISDGNRMAALYDALVWTDPATGVVQPQMAESLAPDDGNKVWRLRVKPNIKFSDGAPLNADAVKASWEAHKDSQWRSAQQSVVAGLQLQKEDEATLKITLPSPNANFDRLVSASLNFIVSPVALKDPESLRKKPVGAGPFMFSESVPGKLTLVKNPSYWKKGMPYLDKVVFTSTVGVSTAAREISKNDATATVTIDAKALADARERNIGNQQLNLSGGLMVVFNTAVAPLNDERFRRAIVLAANGAEVNEKYYNNQGTPARGIFNSNSPLANNQLAPGENRPDEARAIFAKLAAEGKKMSFTYAVTQDPATHGVGEHLKEKLAPFGVTVEIKEMSVVDLAISLATRKYEAALSGLWADDPEPHLYQLLHSKSGNNFTNYGTKEIDEQLEKARVATDQDSRREAYTKVQQMLNSAMPFWVFQEASSAVIYGNKVTGVQPYNDGLILWERIGLK